MGKRYSLQMLIVSSFATCLVTLAVAFPLIGGPKKTTDSIVTPQKEEAAVPSVSVATPAAWVDFRPTSFADLAEKVQPAVVNISTTKVIKRQPSARPFSPYGQRDPFDDFFEKFFEGVPQEQRQRSLGSGVIIDKDGTILTNSHVIAGADEIEVKLADGRSLKAEVAGADERTDIAVIKVKAKADLPFVPLGDSDRVRPGDWAMAIGNPFGLEHTVTVGVVSATGRVIGGGPYAKFIQTDASINPGNSGGPLFNLNGEVIGINTMIYATGQGIGFAIPVNLAKKIAPQLSKGGAISRGWLGVSIQEMSDDLAKSFGLDRAEGALIAEVFKGSPAEKAGLQRGDIVTTFDGQLVKDPYDLSLAVGATDTGKTVNVEILRAGQKKTLRVDIGKQEGEAKAAPQGPRSQAGKADKLGLVIRAIDSAVVIERVEPESASEASGLEGGDVIVEINEKRIGALEDYNQAVNRLKAGDVVRILVRRGDASIYIAFRLPAQ
ncbi:MAG: DegQ family serine endoprotease [Deltaproteobacteria bacterium]|nr:DegQ family serine endoprotease [Deltaproteobacteria bacterium]